MTKQPTAMMSNADGNGAGVSGPIEILLKTKWYRATASIQDGHFGISLNEEQADGPLSASATTAADRAALAKIPEGKRTVVVCKTESAQGHGVSIKGGKENKVIFDLRRPFLHLPPQDYSFIQIKAFKNVLSMALSRLRW